MDVSMSNSVLFGKGIAKHFFVALPQRQLITPLSFRVSGPI